MRKQDILAFLLLSSVFVFGVAVMDQQYKAYIEKQRTEQEVEVEKERNIFLDRDRNAPFSEMPCITFVIGKGIDSANTQNYLLYSLENVTNEKGQVEFLVGDKVKLRSITSYQTDTQPITWSSSHPEVVTVTEDGSVKAVGGGTATVSFRCGGLFGGLDFVVHDLSLQKIELSNSRLDLQVKESKSLRVSFCPENTISDKKVTWQSSDPTVASVNYGVITGKKPGKTVITVQSGDVKAFCEVYVKNPLDDIRLSCISSDIEVGNQLPLQVFYQPEDTSEDKSVRWSSSDAAVATVDKAGVVTAIAPGTAKITAQVGRYTADCQLRISRLMLNTDTVKLSRGDTTELHVQYNTAKKAVEWSSEDIEIVKVTDSGVLTAIQPGETTVTAKVGQKTLTCQVIVTEPTTKDTEQENP